MAYENINLRRADNGYTINYTEKTKPSGGGEFSNMIWNDRTEVFADADADKAWERFNDLHGVKVVNLHLT